MHGSNSYVAMYSLFKIATVTTHSMFMDPSYVKWMDPKGQG